MENIYQAPSAELVDAPVSEAFFVTSTRKMLVLHLSTFGLYTLFWFYCHWKAQRDATGENLWPWARAFFQIFFTHSLGRAIADRLTRDGHERWDYSAVATIYVVAAVAAHVLGRLTNGSVALDLLTIAIGLLNVFPLIAMQRKANLACGDEHGQSNARFTLANLAWMLLGLVWWALAMFGFFMQ
ncbi:MFS transporter permease [Stutzerimonas chloritidismutans]|uniref:MFS transporter permease n=1 Tax=Stutzerimonas chloritidismutans TaxID=203192 RepID=UPI003F143316